TQTGGCVGVAVRVAPKRRRTGGCIQPAVCVARKRRRTGGCIEVTLCIALERQVADRRVVDGVLVVIERTKADRRVVEAGCKAEKRIITLSSVVIRIAAAWCGKNRSSCWRKREASQCKCDENKSRSQKRSANRSFDQSVHGCH